MTTSSALDDCLARLQAEDGVLVQVMETRGSTPRETGAWMAVWANGLTGTIGGGNLEYQALEAAQAMLTHAAEAPAQDEVRRYALGPSLGQCCGGVVFLSYERINAADRAALRERLGSRLKPIALFGGGHVGNALVRVLSTLPYRIHWIDSRDDMFPAVQSAQVQTEHSDPVHAAVDALAPGSRVLVMSFSHWEDLDIIRCCLDRQRERGDLPFVGLIGSKTKWAVFRHRLAARGYSEAEMAQVTTPIGIPGIKSKEPEIIAVAVAAQLLQLDLAGHFDARTFPTLEPSLAEIG